MGFLHKKVLTCDNNRYWFFYTLLNIFLDHLIPSKVKRFLPHIRLISKKRKRERKSARGNSPENTTPHTSACTKSLDNSRLTTPYLEKSLTPVCLLVIVLMSSLALNWQNSVYTSRSSTDTHTPRWVTHMRDNLNIICVNRDFDYYVNRKKNW